MPQYDILAMGNAIVDVISSETPDFLSSRGIEHGCMRLIDAAEAEALYAAMGPGREISGGSAANSVVGAAALGARTAFVGRVAGDQLGQVFTHDIRAAGVAFDTAAATGGPPHRALPDRGDARWRAHDEHLSGRLPGTGCQRSGCRTGGEIGHSLSGRLSVGSGGAACRHAGRDQGGARGGQQGGVHLERRVLRGGPSRRFPQPAGKPCRHHVRQRE